MLDSIDFEYLTGKLKVHNGSDIIELFIADASKKFVPADYIIKSGRLIVFNKNIKTPVAVRFGFTDISISSLFNKNNLPVSPFRTDNWDQ